MKRGEHLGCVHSEPFITVGKGIGAASCGCGWDSDYVWGGALGATYVWAQHVAEYERERRNGRAS